MWFVNYLLELAFRILPVHLADRIVNFSLPVSEWSLKFTGRLDPDLFEYLSRRKLLYLFRNASEEVPAYREFLKQNNTESGKIKNVSQFNDLVPQTTKDNYVRIFSLAERCFNGELPLRGTIEESSGSSGTTTYWIKSFNEEMDNMAITRTAMRHLFGFGKKERIIIVNTLATGGWTGNLRFESRIGLMGLSKNIGPEPEKIIRVMQEFGPGFTYLIGGYPPFLPKLIEFGKNPGNFDWKKFKVHIYTSGEGFTEDWRAFIISQLREGCRFFSGYGAIDLDVGVAAETPFTVALRKLIQQDKLLRRELLKSDRLPTFIGQYPPHRFYIRECTNLSGRTEPEISVLNLKTVSPKLKYVVGDEGGILTFKEITALLNNMGHPLRELKKEFGFPVILPFPVIFIYGRSNGTISINSAMVSPEEISSAIYSDPELVAAINSFKLSVKPDDNNTIRLFIYLELQKNAKITEELKQKCAQVIHTRLPESNECFRNSLKKNPETGLPVIEIILFRTGIFQSEEQEIKNKYLN